MTKRDLMKRKMINHTATNVTVELILQLFTNLRILVKLFLNDMKLIKIELLL